MWCKVTGFAISKTGRSAAQQPAFVAAADATYDFHFVRSQPTSSSTFILTDIALIGQGLRRLRGKKNVNFVHYYCTTERTTSPRSKKCLAAQTASISFTDGYIDAKGLRRN